MEPLYEQIVKTHNLVIVSHANASIMLRWTMTIFWKKIHRGEQKSGVIWPEQNKGTNPIGTAIVKQAPTMIHTDEHCLRANHFPRWTGKPIFDYRSNVIGVLDITGKACPETDKDFGGYRCQAYAFTGDAANTDVVCGKSPQRATVEKIIQHAQQAEQNCSAQSNIQPSPFRTDANSVKQSAINHRAIPTGNRT